MDDIASAAALPGSGSWCDIDESLRQSFTGCPDLPRMGKTLARMKRAAQQAAHDHPDGGRNSIVQQQSRSFLPPYYRVDLSLSYETTPDSITYQDCPILRWHLSMSTDTHTRREPVHPAELAGWIIAGFPDTTHYAQYTLATATARHADIPIH